MKIGLETRSIILSQWYRTILRIISNVDDTPYWEIRSRTYGRTERGAYFPYFPRRRS